MAENVLETRIQLRYGTYSEWMNSNVILKKGEAAVCAFPNNRTIDSLSNSRPENTPPAIGIKIGDGVHYFYELPWVQGIAADVYNWAKSSTKPTYTAQEIEGLQNYVENLISGDVEVTIAPRIYQLIEGSGDNEHKYYLRYKENNEESNWVIDTSTYIDLSDLSTIVNWIGRNNIDNYANLITRNAEQIRYFLGNLVYTDAPLDNQFITSVSENNGIINVERAQPKFVNIGGVAAVEQGGTGRTSLPDGEVLIGNDTGAIRTLPIAESITTSNAIVPSNVIKSYVDSAVAGLTGAMHFIGDATVVINNNSSVNPNITGYDFSKAQPGDVILYDTKEFVWTGTVWSLLGDEGSYVVKGSITDADIDQDAGIQQSKIAGLDTTFDTKVDKIEGKTLSSNDFTDELKQKLESIGTNAETNVIEHILLNDIEILPTTIEQLPKAVNLQIQEFNEEAQTKLNNIEAHAQVNRIEKILYDGTELTPNENKTIEIISDPHREHENVIESITINGTEFPPNKDKQVNITIDQAALNLNVLEGAQIPTGGSPQEVEQINKKLQLARIAATGDVKDLLQSNDEYVTLYCGSSTDVI